MYKDDKVFLRSQNMVIEHKLEAIKKAQDLVKLNPVYMCVEISGRAADEL